MKKIKNLNIAVIGASGRMGQKILQLCVQNKSLYTTAKLGISRSSAVTGYELTTNSINKSNAKNIDVIIDFSLPENFKKTLDVACLLKKPLVSGVTGLKKKDLLSLERAAKDLPILWASNMSLGIAILQQAMSALSAAQNFNFQIEEIHHEHKKDKPSGTAISLQQHLHKICRSKELPEPVSIRGGGVYGVHRIYALSQNEVLCFEHQALNREVFAEGALRAARWLSTQKPGLYKMSDVLNLKQELK